MDSLRNASLSPEPIASRQRLTPLAPQAKTPKVASESDDRPPSRSGTRPPDPGQLPCPRCDSTNTKFCYYNNYNFSQPRHFCKSCRRYWTRGGALRNVPVGGGTRKASLSNKRSRVATATSSKCNNLVNSINDNDVNGHQTQTTDPVVSRAISGLGCGSGQGAAANANEAAVAKSGSLNSWWDGQIGMGSGLLPFGGYGLGLAPSMDFEEGLLDWPIGQVSGGDGGAVLVTGDSPDSNMWQIGGGAEDSVIQGDYFSWPEVAISTPAKALK